jgi:cell division protein FtsN
MKRFTIFLLLSVIMLSGCEWYRTRILKKPSKAEIARLAAQQRMQDSLDRLDSIAQAKQDSIDAAEATKDSLAEETEEDASPERNPADYPFHVISGSFRNPSYAERYKERMISEGYRNTFIVQRYGYNFVSISQHESAGQAYSEARGITNQGKEVWVFRYN